VRIARSMGPNSLGASCLKTNVEPASETYKFGVLTFVTRWTKSKSKRLYLFVNTDMLTLLSTIFTRPETRDHLPAINHIHLRGTPLYTKGQTQH